MFVHDPGTTAVWAHARQGRDQIWETLESGCKDWIAAKPTGTVRRFPSDRQLSYACLWQGLVSWTHGG